MQSIKLEFLRRQHTVALVNIDPDIHEMGSFPSSRSLRSAELLSYYLTPFACMLPRHRANEGRC
jgi:hypothetical protein